MILTWAVLAAVFLAVELVTVSMVSIWCVAGALAALAAAALGAALWLQFVLFVLVTGICFALLYPRLKSLVGRRRSPTNADMVIGRTCIVTRRIDNLAGTGSVSVDGKTWTARSADGGVIEPDTQVRADRIEGVKLIVTPIKNIITN